MIELMLAVFLHSYIVYSCFLYKDKDLHKDNYWWAKWYILVAVAAVMAFICHPGKNSMF